MKHPILFTIDKQLLVDKIDPWYDLIPMYHLFAPEQWIRINPIWFETVNMTWLYRVMIIIPTA